MPKKPRYFYGWNIVAASFLSRLAYAEHHSSMLGLFFKPLQNEFGWSRTAIAAVQTIARVTEAVTASIVGPLVDRHGARVLMPIGSIIVGLTMLMITQIDALWQFYLLRGFIAALGFTLVGGLVSDVAVNNWFIRKRGRAIAFGRVGGNISNIIFVPITVYVLSASDWRMMFAIFAVVTWIVVLIPSAVLMRRRPEDMGLYPDGTTHPNHVTESPENKGSPAPTPDQSFEPVWTRREVLRTGSFWILAACFSIDSMAFQGITISLAAYVQDLGYDDAMLMAVMTYRSIIMATAFPLMGFVAEHTNRASLRVIPFILQAVGAILFLLGDNPILLWLAVTAYGAGVVGVNVIQEVTWANYFGRLSLGRVRSLSYLFAFGLGSLGPLAMNAVFDIRGSYRPAFLVVAAMAVFAGFLIAISKPAKHPRYAGAGGIPPSPGKW